LFAEGQVALVRCTWTTDPERRTRCIGFEPAKLIAQVVVAFEWDSAIAAIGCTSLGIAARDPVEVAVDVTIVARAGVSNADATRMPRTDAIMRDMFKYLPSVLKMLPNRGLAFSHYKHVTFLFGDA
jgi:hypothetical protein